MVPITTTTRRGIFFVNTYDDTDRRPLSQVYREHSRAYRAGGSELQSFNYFIERARIEGLAADAADRLRRRLLAHPYAFSEMTSLEECLPPDGERRWLLQGLWPYGTFPALVGQAKVGKSTLIAQLVAELATENGRFLGFRSTLTREERARRIVVVNAEVNPQDYAQAIVQHLPDEAELEDAEEYPMDNIRLINLAAANEFDLTDPEKYDRWKLSLTEVTEGGERAPAVLIVDGLTPILEGAGTPADKPGPLVQAIKNLCREVGIDNALMVAHTIQNGGHQLGGIAAAAGPDGTWRYVARDPDAHNPTRKFSVKPRMGGMLIPPTKVIMDEHGRLTLAEETKAQDPTEAKNTREKPDYEALVLAFVAEHHATSGSWPSSTDLRAVRGSKPATRAARDALVASGRLVELPRSGRGGGSVYALPEVTS